MAQLYPPSLDGILSAQCEKILKIQFSHNPLVTWTSGMKISLKIKTVTTNTLVFSKTSSLVDNNIAIFNLSNLEASCLTAGEYYKAQIAYVDVEKTIGYYSSIGVFKYLGLKAPTIKLDTSQIVKNNKINFNNPIILKDFSCPSDPTEKEYSYQIDIFFKDIKIYSSGIVLHNPEEEQDKYYASDFSIADLDKYMAPDIGSKVYTELLVENEQEYLVLDGQYLTIQCTITTNNSYVLTVSSTIDNISYTIPQESNTNRGIQTIKLNPEDGLIELTYPSGFLPTNIVLRWCWDDKTWVRLGYIKDVPYDASIEQGKSYSYKLKYYETNNNVTYRIMADFEDIFLSDGKRQLAIRYNPEINSFKEIVNDSTITTLGSQYPFVIRNGDTKYKEFSLGGLILSETDENELFFSFGDKEKEQEEIRTRTCSQDKSVNLDQKPCVKEYKERMFKLEVLEWLNNGEVKLLRTGREGNYLVRLTDVILTPESASARLFHSFSCNAVEVAEYNVDNLQKYIFPNMQNYSNISVVAPTETTVYEVFQ